jgi:vancomycin resistance protein YoaR
VERYNHGYVVDWYGEPGMDATIFTPTVDFRFRNDTGAIC